jgi:pimeloyl-ACP methyl ester carboxylesterase
MIGLVDVGSTELFVSTLGTGPTLLLISGATGTADDWATVARLLADEFTVVTFDRPGISRSPRPAATIAISLAQQADDAAGLLRVLHLAPAVVVGHGGGGSVACELVAHHPRLVRLAVVCGTHPAHVPDVDRLQASGVPVHFVPCEPSGDGGSVGLPARPDAFAARLGAIIHNGGDT